MSTKRLNIYNLAEIGLDLAASPVHRKFGTLTKAQNCVMLPNEGEGAVDKRGGLSKLNTIALSGQVHGLTNISQQLQSIQRLWVAYENPTTSGFNWTYSEDGTTWVDSNAAGPCMRRSRRAQYSLYMNAGGAAVRDRMLYPSNDYIIYNTAGHSAPPVRLFDGTNDYLFGKVPFNQQIQIAAGTTLTNCIEVGFLTKFQGLFYFTSLDDSATRRGTVWSLDPFSGQMRRVGNSFAGATWATGTESNRGAPWFLTSWGNKLWAITNEYAGAKTCAVYRIRPGVDTTWIKDFEVVAGTYGMGICVHAGFLYATFMYDAGVTPKSIYRRSSDGVWTAVDTIVAANYAGYFRPFSFDSKIFAFRASTSGSTTTTIRASADGGTTWADDLSDANLNTLIGRHPDGSEITTCVTFKGNQYVIDTGSEPTRNGNILKRVPGNIPGTWSVVKSAAAGFTGQAAVITTEE